MGDCFGGKSLIGTKREPVLGALTRPEEAGLRSNPSSSLQAGHYLSRSNHATKPMALRGSNVPGSWERQPRGETVTSRLAARAQLAT